VTFFYQNEKNMYRKKFLQANLLVLTTRWTLTTKGRL